MHYVHRALRPLGADYFQDPHKVLAGLRAELPAVPVAIALISGLERLPVRLRLA